MRESYQKNCLSLEILWEPGSQVPTEFAAVVVWLIILLLMIMYAFLCSPNPWVSFFFTTKLSLRQNLCMVDLSGAGVPTYRNHIVILKKIDAVFIF